MKPNKPLHIAIIVCVAALFAGCSTSVRYIVPSDLQSPEKTEQTIAKYTSALKGKTVFIDPGHGGEDRSGVSPNEELVEADINLRVAKKLRDYLMRAGANVIMSRESDITVPLASRPERANASNADLFISIHHNAAGNPETNYTTVFYHSKPGTAAYLPSSHDLAKFIQRDLAYAMRNPGPLASFDGTMSDYLIYPGEGFAVLRDAQMTAVLVECSFFTSTYEEQRLKEALYNDIEAWGIFHGIGKYVLAGIPNIAFESSRIFTSNTPKIDLHVSDEHGIDDQSIKVFIDNKDQGFLFNKNSGTIEVQTLQELSPGYHLLSAQVRNLNGNSAGPFGEYFSIGIPPHTIRAVTTPSSLPGSTEALAIVRLEAVDSLNRPCADGMPIHFETSTAIDTVLHLRDGRAFIQLSPDGSGDIGFRAWNGPVATEGQIRTDDSSPYTYGYIVDHEDTPIPYATVRLPGGTSIEASNSGAYVLSGRRVAGLEAVVSANGYFSKRIAIEDRMKQPPIVLQPVARGTLRGQTVFVEAERPLFLGSDSTKQHLAAQSAGLLTELLQSSGAQVFDLTHTASQERDSLLSAHPNAIVLQTILDRRYNTTILRRGPLESSRDLSRHIVDALRDHTDLRIQQNVPRIWGSGALSEHTQVSVSFPAPGRWTYEESRIPHTAWTAAWGIYNGILTSVGYDMKGTKLVEANVVEKESRNPASYVEVVLNGALRGITNEKGVVRFYGVSLDHDDLAPVEPGLYEITGVKTEILH